MSGFFNDWKEKSIKEDKDIFVEQLDFSAEQNFLKFFDLLLKIDKRINPQNYQQKQNDRYNHNDN